MITLETALYLHNRSIEEFGGGNGIRDEGALLAALARPYQTFDQQELYLSPVEKAAAIFESLIINHPSSTVTKEQHILNSISYVKGDTIPI
jgi:death on curing protein